MKMPLYSALVAAWALAGCGSIANLAASGDQKDAKSSGGAKLTEEAAEEENADAEDKAQESDSAEGADVEQRKELPAFLQVVDAAREYTRELLGLSDEPLKEFKAAVEAAKALASSPE